MKTPFGTTGILALALALGLSGCGSDSPTSGDSAGTRTTDTFSGTLQKQGSAFHLFTVTNTGAVDITLTKTEPVAAITIGLGISQTAAGACIPVLIAYNNTAQAGTVLSGTAAPGAYCVAVYDLGNVPADPLTYTVTVSHL